MDAVSVAQLVILSATAFFIKFSCNGLEDLKYFLFKLLQSWRRQQPEAELDFCVCSLWDLSLACHCSGFSKRESALSVQKQNWR